MTFSTDHLEFVRYAPPARSAGRRNLLWRIADAISRSRQRHADRDIAAYLARSGGRLTDAAERELMDRLSRSAFGEPRR